MGDMSEMSLYEQFKEAGLIGCMNDSGVTSENYRSLQFKISTDPQFKINPTSQEEPHENCVMINELGQMLDVATEMCIKDEDGCIANFRINYCPICGEKLRKS